MEDLSKGCSQAELNDYLYKTIMNNSRETFIDILRREVKQERDLFEDSDNIFNVGVEETGYMLVDKRSREDGLDKNLTAMLKMIEEGATIREVRERFNMGSMRQFYTAKQNLIKDLKDMGEIDETSG